MNLLPYVERARAEFPAALLTADEVASCLYRAAQYAQADGFDVGVLLKPHGTGGMSPAGRISLDILIDIPDQQEYDAFASADGENGAPGPAIPVWHKLPFKVGVPPSGASMDRVRRPVGTAPPVPPVPEPEPEPTLQPQPGDPQPTLADLLEAIDAVYAAVGGFRQEIDVRFRQLEEAATAPRAIEIRVPSFGGTARGTLKSPE